MRHKIEEGVRVYLVLNEAGTAWEIDGVTMDGYPLDSTVDDGARNEACDCDDKVACEAMREKADRVTLPSGNQLIDLLTDYEVSQLSMPDLDPMPNPKDRPAVEAWLEGEAP